MKPQPCRYRSRFAAALYKPVATQGEQPFRIKNQPLPTAMTTQIDTKSDFSVEAELSPKISKKRGRKPLPKTGDTSSLTASTWRVCVRKPECLGGAITTISLRHSVRVELTALAGGIERRATDALRYAVAGMTVSEYVHGDVSEISRKRATARLNHQARMAELDAARRNNAAWDEAQ